MSSPSFRKIRFLKTLLLKFQRGNSPYTLCQRYLLSPSYQCADAWNHRFEGPLFKGLDLDDFFVQMDKKLKAKRKVTALDIDLFVNSIDSDDRFEELNHILYLFRRTRSTVRTLDSTHHAVVRLLIKYGQYELLLKILKDRIGYGIFPDHYAMNLAIDALIEDKKYQEASQVASLLMLQEDLDHPVTKCLGLYACHMHLREEEAKPWHDATPAAQDDEEEEVLVRVPYVRNPYFDDHFDLTLREHLLGKTLYYITRGMNDVVGRSYGSVGLALYEKWPRLLKLLEQFQEAKETILKESAVQIKTLLTSRESQKNSTTEQEQETNDGSIETDSSEHAKDNYCSKISDRLTLLEESGLIVDGNLHELVCDKLKTLHEIERDDIKTLMALYQQWEDNRNKELKREMTLVSLREDQQALLAKKKELKDREQLLYFYENEDKHMMDLAEIDEEIAQKAAIAVSEEDYIVPELPRKQLPSQATQVRRTKATVSL